ncbi:GspE/PulE family protein [Pseudomonas sp. 460]|uniref:GspE/PulE family protein n=1 Tax=Pseudomonas sp. 460 TaxID=2485142 RepID=UPI00104E53CB|nr:GspE/PulE family protein [Pseudomonas sp. 460]TCV51506.1 general secretion pathway protein E [Pseudomonas sp. 460]
MIKEPPLFIHSGPHDKVGADYLNRLFETAAKLKAPDIHMQWVNDRVVIQMRIGDFMQPVEIIDSSLGRMLDDKIRARANMDLSQRHAAIDGRMSLRYPDRAIDVRVSVLPCHGGQKIVCRLLDQSNASMTLDHIHMPALVKHHFMEMLKEPQGLILVTGPTGSGKTTTLYAALNELNDGTLNINTLENPVEYVVPGFVQVNVTPYVTFASGLRALLRQDPDVILVGEIRDAETAEIAMQAANTGHLVLSTLHTNNAAQAVPRLIDLGVDKQALASTLLGVIAQRLVQTLNNNVQHQWTDVTDAEVHWLKSNGLPLIQGQVPRATAKESFSGKRPIIEMIKSDKHVRAAILGDGGEMAVLNAATRQPQFDTLGQAGIRMVSAGTTTMELVQRLIKDDSVAPSVRRIGDVLLAQGLVGFTEVNEAAESQLALLVQGKVRKVGQILVDQGLVTQEQVARAMGYTEGAVDFLYELAARRLLPYGDVKSAVQTWRTERHQESLFDLVIELKLITQEKLDEEVYRSDGRRYVADVAPVHDGSGAGAVIAV